MNDLALQLNLWTTSLALAIDRDQSGGKAVNLARLIGAGFRVPDGFVVTTTAFRFAQQTPGERAMPSELATQIIDRYRAMGSPSVAVRSSATAEDLVHASMAGQYETLLDVRGEDQLLAAIERCWHCIDAPRIRAYLRQHQIPRESVAMAVIVQRLVPAQVAGVLFTANPRNGDTGQMLIEASWGLGEMVVSGQVQPDTLVLDAADGTVLEASIATKALALSPGSRDVMTVSGPDQCRPCLMPKDVHELWRLGTAVAREYGRPQDLEWARRGDELYLLQSRAITTLDDVGRSVSPRQIAQQLRDLRKAGHGPWVLHNLAETLPHPTPLTWSVMASVHSGGGGLGALYRMVGFEPAPTMEGQSFLQQIAGRPYMDLSRAPQMFSHDFPFAYDTNALRHNANAGQAPPTLPIGSLRDRLRAARLLSRVNRRVHQLADDFDRQFEQVTVPAFDQWVREQSRIDLTDLAADRLLELWDHCRVRVLDEFAPHSLLPSFIAGHVLAAFGTFLAEHFWDEDVAQLSLQLSTGGPPDQTVLADHDLYEVAHGRMSLEDWLQCHGHRAPGEFDLGTPRWRERPNDVLRMARVLHQGEDPLTRHEGQQRLAAAEAAARRDRLPRRARPQFDHYLSLLHRYLPYRENAKHELMRGYALLRDVARAIGRRCGADDEVFLLTQDEMRRATRTGYAPLQTIADRRAAMDREEKLSLPNLLDDKTIAELGSPTTAVSTDDCDAWQGFGISSGRGSGLVAVLDDPEQGADLVSGYVLVCRSTDPSWTPLFVNASGIVLERGGALSHGAVVAREMGIPAVVLSDARQLLKSSEMVSVDGGSGRVCRGVTDDVPVVAEVNKQAPAPHFMPPPQGAGERRAATLRNVFLIAWLAFLLAFFVLPPTWLRQPTMALLDAILWPMVPALGRPAAVALIGAALAALTMGLQRILSDHRRLREVKRRSRELARHARSLPATSPHRRMMLDEATRGQRRIMASAFVPLAVLLGPLILTFLWLQQRIDPALTVALPGETIRVVATVNGDWIDAASLQLSDGLMLHEASSLSQTIPPVRQTLVELRSRWRNEGDLSGLPWETRWASRLARQQMLADLDAFLDGPMKPQQLAWTLVAGQDAGVKPLTLSTAGRSWPMRVAIGSSSPPQAVRYVGEPLSVQEVRIIYPPRLESARIFCRPLHAIGVDWDIGWLGVYILAYVPVMFLIKAILRVP